MTLVVLDKCDDNCGNNGEVKYKGIWFSFTERDKKKKEKRGIEIKNAIRAHSIEEQSNNTELLYQFLWHMYIMHI